VHLALVRGVGEVRLTELLDGLRAAIVFTDRKTMAVQALLLLALLLDVLLWARRADWSGLLSIYGLWAFQQAERDLTLYSCATLLAVAMEALELVSPDAEPAPALSAALWLLLLTKIATLATSLYFRFAFA